MSLRDQKLDKVCSVHHQVFHREKIEPHYTVAWKSLKRNICKLKTGGKCVLSFYVPTEKIETTVAEEVRIYKQFHNKEEKQRRG